MTTIKTAISIDDQLFERVETLADEMQISRSRLFVLAIEEFLQRRQNQRLFEAINEVYGELPVAEERAVRQAMRRKHRRHAEGEW